jgi:hypothetical protein
MATPARLRLGAEVLLAYVRVRLLLARRSLPRAVERLRRAPSRPAASAAAEPAPAEAWRCARAVVRVLRPLPADSRCLVRSLVLLSLLARRRIEATLVVGAAVEPRFAAHAWVELEGVPLLEPGTAGEGRLVEL